MTALAGRFSVVDAHTHFSPEAAGLVAEIMAANRISRVVNAGILWVRGIPFEEGMRAFRQALGDRMVYFPTPDFRDTLPGFGQRTGLSMKVFETVTANVIVTQCQLGFEPFVKRRISLDGDLV